jgi:hypothetical protein
MVLFKGLAAHFGYRAGKTRTSEIRSLYGFWGVRKVKWMARRRREARGDAGTRRRVFIALFSACFLARM